LYANNSRLPNNLINSTLLCYKKFKEQNLNEEMNKKSFRKKNKDAILAVCFYYVAKSCNNLHITSDYVCKIFDINNKIFSKYCKIYNEFMNNNCDNKIFEISNLVERYTVELNLCFVSQKLCKNIVDSCIELNILINTCPQGIIAGAIHFINMEMNLKIEKKEISEACSIGENTITRIYKKINLNKNKIFTLVKKNKEKI